MNAVETDWQPGQKRTDVHRPSAMDPEAYELEGFADFHGLDGYRPTRRISELVDEGYHFGGDYGGGAGACGHCGAHIRYAALMSHKKSMTLIWVGEQCLDNRFDSGMTKDEFQRMRKLARLNSERRAKSEKIAELCEAHPLLAWLTYWGTDSQAELGSFLSSLAWKLDKYGELSPRQIETAEAAIVRETNWRVEREERQAREDAEPKTEVPEGRQVVTGEVLSTKWVENDFGGSTKMLVKDDRGFKVWGTVPSAIVFDVEKGSRVSFTATLKRSDDDECFGFSSRPTKAEVL